MANIGRGFIASVKSYKGFVYVDIRHYYGNDQKPGIPGITLNKAQWTQYRLEAPKVIDAVEVNQEIPLGGGKVLGMIKGKLYLGKYDENREIPKRNRVVVEPEMYHLLKEAYVMLEDELFRLNEYEEDVPVKNKKRVVEDDEEDFGAIPKKKTKVEETPEAFVDELFGTLEKKTKKPRKAKSI